MIVLLISIVFVLVVIIIPYYKCKIRHFRQRNNVHFYVARDKNGELFLYMGKPVRGETDFIALINKGVIVLYSSYFEYYGLNEKDYANLKWEDEPIEVFVNMED